MLRPTTAELGTLPALEREVLRLRLVRQLSTEQVAAELGKTPAQVRRIQRNALRRLSQDEQAEAPLRTLSPRSSES